MENTRRLEGLMLASESLAAEGLIEQVGFRDGEPTWIATEKGRLAFLEMQLEEHGAVLEPPFEL